MSRPKAKPKRNARRQARETKRGFADRTVRDLPAVRITSEGREFVRATAAEGRRHGSE